MLPGGEKKFVFDISQKNDAGIVWCVIIMERSLDAQKQANPRTIQMLTSRNQCNCSES